MTVLPDLSEVLERTDTIDLPIRGEVVSFPGTIPVRAGLVLLTVRAKAQQVANDKGALDVAQESVEELDDSGRFADDVFGPDGRQRLIDIGCTEREMGHVFATLLAWHLSGPEAGKAVWTNPGEVQARVEARAATAAEASTTRTPASGSGTRSKVQAGSTSSSSGRRSKPTSPPTTASI